MSKKSFREHRVVGVSVILGLLVVIAMAAQQSRAGLHVGELNVAQSPTATPTATPSPTATISPTPDATPTATPSPTATVSPTPDATPTATPSPTMSPTPTPVESPTASPTPIVGPPTDAEQCKNDGWRTFNTPRKFKNQGDCVSFVESNSPKRTGSPSPSPTP